MNDWAPTFLCIGCGREKPSEDLSVETRVFLTDLLATSVGGCGSLLCSDCGTRLLPERFDSSAYESAEMRRRV